MRISSPAMSAATHAMDAADDPALLEFSIEAEQAVIGGLLLDNAAFDRIELDAEHFYVREHRVIFGELISMHEEGIATDALTVHDRLDTKGRAAEVGGLSRI